MSASRVSVEQLEAIIRYMPDAFTILDFVDTFLELFPDLWQQLVDRYGLYGSGTRYSALTYLSNRLSSYSKRKTPGLYNPCLWAGSRRRGATCGVPHPTSGNTSAALGSLFSTGGRLQRRKSHSPYFALL